MATRSTVCPACSTAVPRGRLACPSCGFLLASVAGRRRAPASASGPATTTAAPTDAGQTEVPTEAPTEAPTVVQEPGTGVDVPSAAGAYIPPSPASAPHVMPARAWAGLTSVVPRQMAPATAGAMSGAPGVSMPGGAGTNAVANRPVVDAAPPTSTTSADSPPAADPTWLEAAAGWLTIIGSAVAILGFLLPWSRTVIGAEGAGSYFDTWGMANPSHLLVVLALLAVLGLAIVANPIPRWIRTCAAGLLLGGLLVGLTWPYLVGPLGAGPGVMAILVGGLMLATAGILDLTESRHATSEPVV